ncbi:MULTISPECIES: TRAP transporter substrate-binding protein [Halomonadaceae]|uniref:TRAP transporter substrate-binding protein n=1 Tax=Halomonadaceae TaxID=28256 RepID=UPI001598C663|nr:MULTISPECIES: TRAP transporter substrate-binding protein [Halomonas]QJQ95202.1 TRAP transporter substrate-binding protein [Halomonas sp. PA5]
MTRHTLTKVAGVTLAALAAAPLAAEEVRLNAIGIVSTHQHHTALEREFYDTLGEQTGLDVTVNFNPLDVVGVNMQDTLRMVRTGSFDVVETTIGAASRDDPFLEGLDLIGVSPDIETLGEVVDAYREVFAERAAERFNARVMTLFPFGPQVFYCSGELDGLADLAGKRVRTFTPSMSALLEYLDATPVTLQFAEVYPALQRGVAECGVTSPTSGNTGNWPEVTDSLYTLGVSWSVQAHMMNLDSWNALSPEAQEALDTAYTDLEEQYWDMARTLTQDAVNCSTGDEACEHYNRFDMTLVEPSEEDVALLNEAVSEVILPTWAETCNANYAECSSLWNSTVGQARGLRIE